MKRLAVLALVGACGCEGRASALHAPPTVRAELVEWVEADTVVRARSAQAELSSDAGVSLHGVEFQRGGLRVQAVRAEGGVQGVWSLLGGVHGWFSGVFAQVVVPDGGAEPRVELDAERMRLDPRARTATLEGAVRIRRGEVVIESARVVVRYGSEGEVISAEASGPVTARTAGGVLVAPQGARADFVARVLVLLGRVRVTQGGAVIEGEGVRVDLSTGAMELQAVRGWLPARVR